MASRGRLGLGQRPSLTISAASSTGGLPWRRPRAWLISCFFAIQAGLFYAIATWAVARYHEAGLSMLRSNSLLSLAMLMGLVGEVSVLSDRVDTLERLLVSKGTLPEGSVDSYVADASVRDQRDAKREQLLRNVLRIIAQDHEDPDAGKPNDDSYLSVVTQVEQ